MHTTRLTTLFLISALTACGSDSELPTLETSSPQPATTETPATKTNPSPKIDETVLLKARQITDPARNNQVAYHLLVPHDWEVEGGVTAVGPAYHMIPTMSDVTVRAPNGRGVRFWGMLEYGYADGISGQLMAAYEGRPFAPIPNSLGEHWERMFQAFPADGVTNLRVVSETVMPEATERLREQMAAFYESTRQENYRLQGTGQSKSFDVEARSLVIRYTEHGRKIEATVFAALRKAIYWNYDGSIGAAMWNLDYMYAVFGPKRLDNMNDPELAAVVRSRREDPNWSEAIQRWYLAKNQQIVAQGQARIAAAARSAAASRASDSQDVLDISFQGWKSRNAANDAGQSLSVNGIHERTTYVEPTGTTVDLPSYYQNVYADGQGNYVLHNDANWTIGADQNWNGRSWERIEPQR